MLTNNNSIIQTTRLAMTDPKALNHVLVQHSYNYPKPSDVKGEVARLLGRGLLLAEGEQHKRQRKLINPTFSLAQLRYLVPLVHSYGRKLSDKWEEKILESKQKEEKCIIDVMPWINHTTVDVIGEAGFAYQFHSLENGPRTTLATAFSNLMTKRNEVMAQSLRAMQEESQKVLHKARHAGGIQDDRKDLLALLVRENKLASSERERISDEEIMGQMTTFLFAGHETTASALTWFLWILAKNPEIQNRLRQEIFNATPSSDEAMEESETTWSLEKINGLPYLDAFCREGFRYISPVTLTNKIATRDDKIPLSKPIRLRTGKLVDHLIISAGQRVIIPIHSFNRSKEIFGKDAHEFKPERWLTSDPPKSGTGLWSGLLTFSAGPRACIGYRFSLVEVKVLLIVLLSKFKFEERDDGGGPEFERRNTTIVQPQIKGQPGKSTMPLRVSLIRNEEQ
ncbi:hypothetical protein O181_000919 [Austropuccinia psidii MF-1]|uniref:Cytochrome P450 n=1 Tax=Austropuccinia psidii MF-1 TaxID=1389203 RepID=A0A9Q3B9H6_9BASI|nr:hypothetical protein [Austropuccinia psidii MF-1]